MFTKKVKVGNVYQDQFDWGAFFSVIIIGVICLFLLASCGG